LNFQGPEERVTEMRLSAGTHTLELVAGGGNLEPGNGNESPNRLLGPAWLSSPDPMAEPAKAVARSRWRELCVRGIDWVDAWRSA
jgi:hypothetical protein